MDIILKNAKKFADNYFRNPEDYTELLSAASDKVYEIDDRLDKIKFLNVLLERNNEEYRKHLLKCTRLDDCRFNDAHENIRYYLTQELNRLGIDFNEDVFSKEDKDIAEAKLDKILNDLAEVKLGQEVIYEDLLKEINELRDLYFLGKKKWYQILVGKSVEMAVGGIVSETVSKQIIEDIKKVWPTLLT